MHARGRHGPGGPAAAAWRSPSSSWAATCSTTTAWRCPSRTDQGRRGKLAPRARPARGLWWRLRRGAGRALVTTLSQAAAEAQRRSSRSRLPPHAVPLRQSAGSYDYRYDAEHRVDVEGDGAWHTVAIGAADVVLEPRLRLRALHGGQGLPDRAGAKPLASRAARGRRRRHAGHEFLMTVPFPAVAPARRGTGRPGRRGGHQGLAQHPLQRDHRRLARRLVGARARGGDRSGQPAVPPRGGRGARAGAGLRRTTTSRSRRRRWSRRGSPTKAARDGVRGRAAALAGG